MPVAMFGPCFSRTEPATPKVVGITLTVILFFMLLVSVALLALQLVTGNPLTLPAIVCLIISVVGLTALYRLREYLFD